MGETMRIVFPLLGICAAQIAFGQLRPPRAGPDLDDLYTRLSESVYVVKGRVTDGKGVGRRAPQHLDEMDARLKGPIRVAIEPGGFLFTVSIDQIVCRQSDFGAGSSQHALSGLVYVFVPRGEPPWQSQLDPRWHFLAEFLERDREYLLFLREHPQQEELAAKYQLDPRQAYYRTFEGDRGAVALPDAAHPERPHAFITPLVDAVTTFCEAVRAPEIDVKIRNLNAVRDKFTYPAWRQSVDAAIRSFQQAKTRPPEQQEAR